MPGRGRCAMLVKSLALRTRQASLWSGEAPSSREMEATIDQITSELQEAFKG
jgi:hypothetical protein